MLVGSSAQAQAHQLICRRTSPSGIQRAAQNRGDSGSQGAAAWRAGDGHHRPLHPAALWHLAKALPLPDHRCPLQSAGGYILTVLLAAMLSCRRLAACYPCQRLPPVPTWALLADVVALLDEWAARFFEELDYVREGGNATRFAAQMAADLPQVVVPSTYAELTSRRVLTSEWLEGEKLSQSQVGMCWVIVEGSGSLLGSAHPCVKGGFAKPADYDQPALQPSNPFPPLPTPHARRTMWANWSTWASSATLSSYWTRASFMRVGIGSGGATGTGRHWGCAWRGAPVKQCLGAPYVAC